MKQFKKARLTLKMIEESLNEIGPPEHDHPENGGRVSWKMVNKYGAWLRRNDPTAFHCVKDDLENASGQYV
jgi:hypothetical protein